MTRVLIIDDERPNRDLLEIMLAPEGFELATAAGGAEGLRSLVRQPPDLVLLDVMMPGMNGYEVTAAIKGDASTRHIPVILLTGLDDHESRERGMRAGADGLLSRPVNRADLCELARQLLRPSVTG